MPTELGAAYISVGLGASTLAKDIRKEFLGVEGAAGASGDAIGKKLGGGIGASLKSAILPALAASGGLLAFGKDIGGLAAEAEQNMGAVGSVFKGAAGEVAAFAADSATKLGVSSSEYNSFASLIGSQLKNAGVPMDQLAGKTNELATKGADLASMFGGTTSDAVGALSSALKGEMDPLEAYGISLNDAAIKGKLAEMGMDGLTGAAAQQAKTQAILALVNQQSADATGNFGREASTAAGAQQIANAQWENARATLGEALLPVMTQMAGALSGVAGWVKENSGLVIGLGIGIGGLAAAVVLANAATSAFAAVQAIIKGATIAWTGVQWALNAAMSANPIGIVIAAIAALVAGVIWAYNNVGWFKDGVDAAFKWVSEAAGAMAKWIGEALGNIGRFFTDTWNNVTRFLTDTWNNIVSAVQAFVGVALGLFFKFNPLGILISNFGAIVGFLGGVWGNIVNGVSGMIGKVTGFFGGLGGKILGALGNIGSTLFNTGKNIIQGLIDGIGSMMGAIGKAVLSIVPEAIRGPFEKLLGIHSPSRVFREYGVNIGQGLILGIDGMHGKVASSVTGLVNVPAAPSFTAGSYAPASAGAGAGAGGGFANYGTINVRDEEEMTRIFLTRQRDAQATFGF